MGQPPDELEIYLRRQAELKLAERLMIEQRITSWFWRNPPKRPVIVSVWDNRKSKWVP